MVLLAVNQPSSGEESEVEVSSAGGPGGSVSVIFRGRFSLVRFAVVPHFVAYGPLMLRLGESRGRRV
jgi:hypothetical protein